MMINIRLFIIYTSCYDYIFLEIAELLNLNLQIMITSERSKI